MDDRLPAAVEAAAVVRNAQAFGDFATVLRRGDPDRGALILVITSRGSHVACLERVLAASGAYRWQKTGPGESSDAAEVGEFLAKRAKFDEDIWLIELDVAQPERFIAETISAG